MGQDPKYDVYLGPLLGVHFGTPEMTLWDPFRPDKPHFTYLGPPKQVHKWSKTVILTHNGIFGPLWTILYQMDPFWTTMTIIANIQHP